MARASDKGKETSKSDDVSPEATTATAEASEPAAPEAVCEQCAALKGTRPCSVECWVKAGYPADTYDGLWGPNGTETMRLASPAVDEEPLVVVDAPKAKATQSGHTVCRVTGTDVMYHGQYVKEGTVGEFEDAIVLDMPKVFVSLE